MKHFPSTPPSGVEPTTGGRGETRGEYPLLVHYSLIVLLLSRTPHDRTDLMVKKLRYYARFIVVCLLLKKMKLVRDLVRELSKLIGKNTTQLDSRT